MLINKLARKSKTFRKLPLSAKWLFIEAIYTSAWVKICLNFFPFTKVMGWLGNASKETADTADINTLPIRMQVKKALELCNRYALWPTECYTLSLTGKLLLKRRRINSTLYIGFKKNSNNTYGGHAWLRANDTYITGYQQSAEFTLHSMFS